MHRPVFLVRLASLIGIAAAILAVTLPAAAQSPFAQDGLAGQHELARLLPNESVDPLSGNLLVTATDLVLPGNLVE